MAAVTAQAELRAEGKIKDKATRSGQNEMFESLLDLGPDKTAAMLAAEKQKARALLLSLTPFAPESITYKRLWALVLAKHSVRRTEVNAMCVEMKKIGQLTFPDWEPNKRVPQDGYRVQRN